MVICMKALEILLASEQFINVASHFNERKCQGGTADRKVQATSALATVHLRDILVSPGIFDSSPQDDIDSGDFDAWLERCL